MGENRTTFMNLIRICKNVEIISLDFEEGLKGQIKAMVRIKGSFTEISKKLDKLVKDLSPFIKDKYFGKWLSVEGGSMDFHEFTGYLLIEVGFRGIGITLE